MKITLASGRSIRLVKLEQRETYLGRLCGKDNAHFDQEHVQRVLTEARDFGPAGCEPCLLGYSRNPELPAVTCIAVFDSGELARPGSDVYSSMVVVWFQDAFSPAVSESALRSIEALDWERLATDWCW